ncbi:MAG: WD40 repeat domain-containing protein [Hyphomicrobiales bacterium]
MAEYPSLTSAVEPLALGEPVVAAAWLGDMPAFALADGAIRLGEAHEERRVQAHPDAAILVAASDGRRLITGGDDGRVVGTDADGAIETIAEEKGKWIDAVAIHEGAIAWSAGRSAHARSAKGEVKSVDLPSTCRGLAFFPKGYRLAASHYNGATIWFPNAGKPELLNWSGSHLDATVSPDGRFLITSMQENTLHGWRIADAKNMRMAGYPGKTRSFSWSNDGKWLATSGADACIIWPFSGKDGPMGQSPRECGVRANVPVTRVAFHPAALVVAIGFDDGLVMISRITDASELLVRRPTEDPKNARISALAWDVKGARLLFGAENGDAGLLTLPKP